MEGGDAWLLISTALVLFMIPGLALAGLWPEASVTLLDASIRRLDPVHRAVRDLDWGARVQIVHARAETAAREADLRGAFDLVVVRLFGPPATAAECAAGFVRVGGHVLVTEPFGDAASNEERWAGLAEAGLGLRLGERVHEPVAVQFLDAVEACPESVPRRDGVPAKRPLF